MSKKRNQVVDAIANKYGTEPQVLALRDIKNIADDLGYSYATLGLVVHKGNKAGHGVYHFPPKGVAVSTPVSTPTENDTVVTPAQERVSLIADSDGFDYNLVPSEDEFFVPFGNFKHIKNILKSKTFYPVFITGLSGNGKTLMVEQACAQTKRPMIRFNFTIETDEDDLIGGFRLVNGETKFFKGPVIKAMEQGAVLLLDEIDLANPAKIMALQSILEGKGYFLKKTGEHIMPAPGFTVVATANTKGKGSDDGRFIGTNILNEAFLERFPITCEQSYPATSIEKKIVQKVSDSLGHTDTEFVEKLVDWADIIRKTFFDGGVDEIISTRRLVHIIRAFDIFGDRMTAIEMCTNRFDDETKQAFLDLYTKVDADVRMMTDEEFVAEHEGV